jgi:hypothetical protein
MSDSPAPKRLGYARVSTVGQTLEAQLDQLKAASLRYSPSYTGLRLERTIWRRDPATGLLKQTCETVFWVSSASGLAAERWNEWIRAHWRIENGSHHVRDMTFAEDASRIRKNPDIVARLRSFAYNLLRAEGHDNIKNARWRCARHQSNPRNATPVLRTEQP